MIYQQMSQEVTFYVHPVGKLLNELHTYVPHGDVTNNINNNLTL